MSTESIPNARLIHLRQYAEDRYGLEPTAANIAHLSRAIANGEGELFTLPKGKSGKVKLYKGPSSITKEVS